MGNLINRYRAVLRKCRVKNAMNRIVLAGALLAAPLFAEGLSSVTGGTGMAWAGTYSLDNQAQDFAHTGKSQTGDAESSGLTGSVGTEHAGDSIYGGLATTPSSQSYDSIASGNNLTIEGDSSTSFSKTAIAGYASNWGSGSSTASNNNLTVTNALFDNNGAYISDTGLVGGMADFQSGDVLGKDAIADNNTVTVQGEGSKVRIRVIGAHASHNDYSQTVGIARADNNHVYIQDGARVLGAVLGAEVHGDTELEEGYAEANGNTVEIRNAFIGEADGSGALYPVTGAYVHAMRVQNSDGNKVVISDSVLSGGHGNEDAKSYVQALAIVASADPVSTTGNSVEFSNSKIDGSVLGTSIDAYGGAAEASGTRVTVQGSKVGGYVLGDLVYSSGGGAAAQTTVSVSDTHVGEFVIGAYTWVDAGSSGDSKASGSVTVNNNSDIASVVYSGYARNFGSGLAEASGNNLEIDHTHVSSTVSPGYARNEGSGKAVSEGNTLVLLGGIYDGSIYGGRAYAAGNTAASGGNIVTLKGDNVDGDGSPSFSAQSTVIWGSYALGGNQMYAPSSPNTLDIIDAKGMTAANIRNFSILKYTLPNMTAQESVLTLTGGADNEKTDISNASVSVAVADVWGRDGGEFGFGGDKSPENDRIILVKNGNGLVSDGWKQEGMIIAREGVSLAFELAAATDDTSLYLYRPETFIDPSDPDHPHPNDTVVNPQTKALAEGWLAGLTLGIQAGNVAADQGIGAMRYAAVRLDRDGWLPFGVLWRAVR